MTEARAPYRLTPRARLEQEAPCWTAATVEGVRLDLVAQFAVEWLALEAQAHDLEHARAQLCQQAEARGVPVPTVLTGLRHLADVQHLETSPAVLAAMFTVLKPLVEEG